jgi:uridine nucleosidase
MSTPPTPPHKHRVIIDTDPGIDDTMALLFALNCDQLDILGLTVVMGNNNDMELMAKNACLSLTMCGRGAEGIPVVKGASAPLSGDYTGQSGIMVHGDNGLGGVQVPEGIIDTTSMTDHRCNYHTAHCMHTALKPLRCVFRRLPCSHTSAAQFIVDTVALHPGEVTLIALGPLTNVARAIQLGGEPFRANLRALSLMGGSFTGRGNKTPAAEANVHNDPEAAKVGSVASSRLPGQRREAKGALDKRQDPPPCATLPLRDLLHSSQLLRIARPHTKPRKK